MIANSLEIRRLCVLLSIRRFVDDMDWFGTMRDDCDLVLKKGTFRHLVVEGSHYEVGKQIASKIKKEKETLELHSSSNLDPKKHGFADFDELITFFETHCPGIAEETRGIADGLGTSIESNPVWGSILAGGASKCSQFGILSSASEDGHIYLGRSYDWIHTDDDLTLITCRVKDKAAHIGCSAHHLGRTEGMNEHGLCVIFTGGGAPSKELKSRGFQFWITIRALLDSCANVEEALNRINGFPVGGHANFLIFDKDDNAALVECADGVKSVMRISASSPKPFLTSTNHFVLPNTESANDLNSGMLPNSRMRQEIIQRVLDQNGKRISQQELLSLLSKRFPEGVCDHWYSDHFGTLWSQLFDLTDLRVKVSFGAPTHNEWHDFDLDDPVGLTDYPVVFPDLKRRG